MIVDTIKSRAADISKRIEEAAVMRAAYRKAGLDQGSFEYGNVEFEFQVEKMNSHSTSVDLIAQDMVTGETVEKHVEGHCNEHIEGDIPKISVEAYKELKQ